jgi:hypothetical protein
MPGVAPRTRRDTPGEKGAAAIATATTTSTSPHIHRSKAHKYRSKFTKKPFSNFFSSIYMDQPLVYVRGCKRDSLHSVCKEFFSLHHHPQFHLGTSTGNS